MKRRNERLQATQNHNSSPEDQVGTAMTIRNEEEMVHTTNDSFFDCPSRNKKMRKLEKSPLHISPEVISRKIAPDEKCKDSSDYGQYLHGKSIDSSKHHHTEATGSECFLSAMPQELLFQIISYFGPSSSTLTDLCRVNKMFHRILSIIADSLMENTKTYFRIPLPKLHVGESKLSHSIRHYRSFLDIRQKCNDLRRLVEKDFVVDCCLGPVIIRPLNISSPGSPRRNLSTTGAGERISMDEIDYALDTALELIGLDSLSYFLAKGTIKISDVDKHLVTSSSRFNIVLHFTEDIENTVFSLVGRCGGKVYKYLRMQQLILKLWYMNNQIENVGDTSVFDGLYADLMLRAKTLMRLVIFLRENDIDADDTTECSCLTEDD